MSAKSTKNIKLPLILYFRQRSPNALENNFRKSRIPPFFFSKKTLKMNIIKKERWF